MKRVNMFLEFHKQYKRCWSSDLDIKNVPTSPAFTFWLWDIAPPPPGPNTPLTYIMYSMNITHHPQSANQLSSP